MAGKTQPRAAVEESTLFDVITEGCALHCISTGMSKEDCYWTSSVPFGFDLHQWPVWSLGPRRRP